MISLLIEYFGEDEVVGGLARQILPCYMIFFTCLNLWHVSLRPGRVVGGEKEFKPVA